MPTALLSVADKKDLDRFARFLLGLNFSLIASGGTAKAIAAAGLPVRDLAELVGSGPRGGHAVVTLYPQTHMALQYDDTPERNAELAEFAMPRIDLLCAVPYDADAAIQKHRNDRAQLYATGLDVGGFALLASAVKGNRIVVSSIKQYDRVVKWIALGLPANQQVRDSLACAALTLEVSQRMRMASYLNHWPLGSPCKTTDVWFPKQVLEEGATP